MQADISCQNLCLQVHPHAKGRTPVQLFVVVPQKLLNLRPPVVRRDPADLLENSGRNICQRQYHPSPLRVVVSWHPTNSENAGLIRVKLVNLVGSSLASQDKKPLLPVASRVAQKVRFEWISCHRQRMIHHQIMRVSYPFLSSALALH